MTDNLETLKALALAHGIEFNQNDELNDNDLEKIAAGKGGNDRNRSINQSVNIGGRGRRR